MNTLTQTHPKAVRLILLLVAFTTGVSLLYGVQFYLGGPLRLSVVSEVHDLALSPNGSLLAVGAQDGRVRLWEVPRSKVARERRDWTVQELSGHTGAVVSVLFDPSGSKLFSASRDGTVRLWNVTDGTVEAELEVPGGKPLSAVSLDARGRTLAGIDADGVVHVWDVAEGYLFQSVGSSPNTKPAVALSTDGTLVATGDGANIQTWDARTGEPVQRLEGYWKDETEKEDWLGHEKEVTALAFSPDGAILVSGGADKTIVFWELETGEVKGTGDGHFAAITRLVFSEQGKIVLSGSADNKAKTWRVPGGKVSGTYIGHQSAVKGVAFGPDAESILTGGDDGSVRLWDTVNTTQLHIEWTAEGLQPVWGRLFAAWMPVSGLLGLVCLWGLRRMWGWSHLLALALYMLGPIVVLGMPLLELSPFPPMRITLYILMLLGSLVCYIRVLIELFRNEGRARGILGILVPIYTFIWGGLKATELQIERIMLGWTGMMGVGAFLARGSGVVPQGVFGASGDGYPLGVRLQVLWPLVVMAAWYAVLIVALTRRQVAVFFEAPRSAALAEQLMASQQARQLRKGLSIGAIWVLLLVVLYSVLRRFDLDLAFMGHFFDFIMQGAWLTFRISAISIALAVVLALFGALGRLSDSAIANGISGFYISLIRGTPLLVQIYIWYLGLPRLGIVLPAEVAGFLALGVNYGAYMTEIFRAGIQAIGIGQYEAAQALGMSRAQTLRRIVLPQAFRIVIPPIGNEFIAMMKDSSLVSIMAVWELSFRAQKIGRQNFRSLETFMIAAAFYWILTVIFQFLQGKLEAYMARGERR